MEVPTLYKAYVRPIFNSYVSIYQRVDQWEFQDPKMEVR